MSSSAFYLLSSLYEYTCPQKEFYFLWSVVLSFQPRLKHMFWLHNQEKVDAVQSSVFYCSYSLLTARTAPWLLPSPSICPLWAWTFSGLVLLLGVFWAVVFWSHLLPSWFHLLSVLFSQECLNISNLLMMASFRVFLGCRKLMIFKMSFLNSIGSALEGRWKI